MNPDTEPYETVELQLAARGADLWLALEAAQFARMLIRETPESAGQSDAVDIFAKAFSDFIEHWDEISAQNRSAVLEALGAHLGTLRTAGLQVHWAIVEHVYDTDEDGEAAIPLAIISVTPDDSPTIELALPETLDIGTEDWSTPE